MIYLGVKLSASYKSLTYSGGFGSLGSQISGKPADRDTNPTRKDPTKLPTGSFTDLSRYDRTTFTFL